MADEGISLGGIVDNLRRVFQVLNEQSKKAEKVTGLTGPQLWAIKVISHLGPIRISDLAREMYLHPATVVGIVDRLEARELVVRVRSTEDRRVVEVGLTDKGRGLADQAPEVAQRLLVKGLETLAEVDLRVVDAGLRSLVQILGAEDLPPRLILSSEVNLPLRGDKGGGA